MKKLAYINRLFFLFCIIFLCAIYYKSAAQIQSPLSINDQDPKLKKVADTMGSGQLIAAVPRGYKAHSIALQYVSTVRGGENALMAGVTKDGKAVLFKGKQWDLLGNKNDFQSCEISGDGAIWGLDKSGGVWRFEKNSWIQFPGIKAQQLSVGTKDEVYIVNTNNQILRRADAANAAKNSPKEELALWRGRRSGWWDRRTWARR